jgi:hypothetical protein
MADPRITIDAPYLNGLIDRLLMPPPAMTEGDLRKLHGEAAEMLSTLARSLQAASQAQPQEALTVPAIPMGVLRQHWLHALECDHDKAMDRPHCACCQTDLGWHPSIGAAVEAWLAHVAEAAAAPTQAQPAQQTDDISRAADFLEQYADYIRREVMSVDIERHPYLPELEQVAAALRAAPQQPAQQAVRVPLTEEAEFELHTDDGVFLAGTNGPRQEAWAEMQRYAAQYTGEGPTTIYEVSRTPVHGISPPPAAKEGENQA